MSISHRQLSLQPALSRAGFYCDQSLIGNLKPFALPLKKRGGGGEDNKKLTYLLGFPKDVTAE